MGLRRLDNAQLFFRKGSFGRGHGVLRLSSRDTTTWKTRYDDFESLWNESYRTPVLLMERFPHQYWAYRGRCFVDNDGLSSQDVHALLLTRQQREQRRLSAAREIVAMGTAPRTARRGAIPEDVKQFVWIRDGGRCRYCNTTAELQFDHVIPVAKGGSSDAENLQILCGPCNRRKSSRIAMV